MKTPFPVKVVLIMLSAIAARSASAQVDFPAPSPHAHFKQMVGLTEIEIDYSRPGVKGREVFGSLVPYGVVWRTGANAPTKLTVSEAVEIGGVQVPAGTYALYSIPNRMEWTIILSQKTDLWGAYGYDEANDLVRFKVSPERLPNPVETFTIAVADLSDKGAKLRIEWDNTRVSIPIKADPHAKVMAQLGEVMSSAAPKKPSFLFNAGFYYFSHGEDANQALVWVDDAISLRTEPAYWMYALKAEILVSLKRKDEAIKTAEEALKLARAAKDLGYARKMESLLLENS